MYVISLSSVHSLYRSVTMHIKSCGCLFSISSATPMFPYSFLITDTAFITYDISVNSSLACLSGNCTIAPFIGADLSCYVLPC